MSAINSTHYDGATITLIRTQALVSFLIAAATSDFEPESNDYAELGGQLQYNLNDLGESLESLWGELKPKPDEDSTETPPRNDVQRMLKIHDLIDTIEGEELKRGMKRVWLEVSKPFLGKELGFIESSPPQTTSQETTKETESE